MLKVLSSILCDLDPKVKALGQKAGICDGVPSTSALVLFSLDPLFQLHHIGMISHHRTLRPVLERKPHSFARQVATQNPSISGISMGSL